MTEKENSGLIETTELTSQQEHEAKVPAELENEFEITVRKLEMPVKPRGVLAE
jgi:hypothetical protein